MQVYKTRISDVLVLEPRVFRDERGFFFEAYNQNVFRDLGIDAKFVQHNHSHSLRDVVRGLHYQVQHPQGKLVRVVQGEIFDVAVDLRRESPTLGQWVGEVLSSTNLKMMYIPVGFAHGFRVLSESTDLLYLTTDFYCPEGERTIIWNDPDLAIAWPGAAAPILSPKDRAGKPFHLAERL